MKKKLFISVMLLAVSAVSVFAAGKKKKGDWWNSYSRAVKENNLLVNAGIGLNGNLGQGGDLDAYIPPFEASVEYTTMIGVPIGFGGFIGYTSYRTEESVTAAASSITTVKERDVFYFGGLANYHFNLVDELDLYAGAKIGLDFKSENKKVTSTVSGVTSKVSEDDDWTSLHFGINAGATYYFSDFFGVNVEAGFPTILRVAASFKFDF
ncbi:outer membrane beta-barrel protein [Treponema sp.]|uniref:outer membrane beta-barrel protein n=1 Tax=Treponema sp. TaxID=166 RepID=UPI0025E0DF5E|nr:outer membrane beta-barrel protein [Treponema sp.]MCR5217996.1 porin family protein [Treponema sp.]